VAQLSTLGIYAHILFAIDRAQAGFLGIYGFGFVFLPIHGVGIEARRHSRNQGSSPATGCFAFTL
jgi:F0F1-type ATP synthase assembly protein I